MTSKLARWWVLGRKDMESPLVTVVKMSGILQSSMARGPQARRFINLDRVEKFLQRAFYKPLNPAAVAIVINSPGGSPTQSELIYDMINRLHKQTQIPVYTFAEDVAASGGYFLLCAGQESYACATSLVGSIGVISSSFGVKTAAERLGIERRVFTAGAAKLPMDPFLPITPEQESRLLDIMTDVHQSFQNIVISSRGDRLKSDIYDEVFSGRAWTGAQAFKMGLIDGVGTMRGIMRDKFGDKTRFLLCSEPVQPGLRDMLGLSVLKQHIFSSLYSDETTAAATSHYCGADALNIEDVGYGVAKGALNAAIDEMEERTLWAKYGIQM